MPLRPNLHLVPVLALLGHLATLPLPARAEQSEAWIQECNKTDLRVNCEAKAKRSGYNENTGAAATARIGASTYQAVQGSMNAWDSFRNRSETGKSISELMRDNAAFIRQLDEEDRKKREQEALLRTPEGKRQYYGQRKGKGNAHDDFLYAIYSLDDQAEGTKWMKVAADGGDPKAQYMIAFWTRMGFNGMKPDGKAAFERAAKAAAGGVPQGLGLMAKMLYYGEQGLDVNDAAALTLAKAGCEQHSSEACETLGQIYRYGDGVPQDLAASRKAFEQAIADQEKPGAFDFGTSTASAYYALAEMHADGEGVPVDAAKARSLMLAFTKAPLNLLVPKGWTTYAAELMVGPKGRYGFAQDQAQGLQLLRRTAERGHDEALSLLGSWTIQGAFGVPKDVNAGIGYLKKAVELNHAHSAVQLGKLMIDSGKPQEGYQWMQTAARLGSPDAMYLQAVYLYKGVGVAQDFSAGRDMLLKACEASHAQACGQAAQLSDTGGAGFAKDPALAQRLMQKARSLGFKS